MALKDIRHDLTQAVLAVRFDGDTIPIAELFLRTAMLLRTAAAILEEADDPRGIFADVTREVLEVFQDHAVPEYENHVEAWSTDALVGALEANLRPSLLRLLDELERR